MDISATSLAVDVGVALVSGAAAAIATSRSRGEEMGRIKQDIENLKEKSKCHDDTISPLVVAVAEIKVGIDYLVKRFDEQDGKRVRGN